MCAFFIGEKMKKILNELSKLVSKASRHREVPVAAVIVHNNKIIAKAYNKRHNKKQTTSHAEIEAIMKANKKMKSWRLNKCTMFVTIKPCEMCETVIRESRIDNVYYFVDRLPQKKQYNKTKIKKIENLPDEKFVNNYLEKINVFWKNKRK